MNWPQRKPTSPLKFLIFFLRQYSDATWQLLGFFYIYLIADLPETFSHTGSADISRVIHQNHHLCTRKIQANKQGAGNTASLQVPVCQVSHALFSSGYIIKQMEEMGLQINDHFHFSWDVVLLFPHLAIHSFPNRVIFAVLTKTEMLVRSTFLSSDSYLPESFWFLSDPDPSDGLQEKLHRAKLRWNSTQNSLTITPHPHVSFH